MTIFEGFRILWNEYVSCPLRQQKLAKLAAAAINSDISRADQTGQYMVAVFRVDDVGTVHLDRHSPKGFPVGYHDTAIELLTSDLARLKATCTCGAQEKHEAAA